MVGKLFLRNPNFRNHPTHQVTFGSSEGRLDTLAGSLTEGWVAMLPADVRSGGSGGDNAGATKALTGTNAIVCAAGGGPLLTKAAAMTEAAKKNGMSLGLTAATSAEGHGRNEGDVQVARNLYNFSVSCCLIYCCRIIHRLARSDY